MNEKKRNIKRKLKELDSHLRQVKALHSNQVAFAEVEHVSDQISAIDETMTPKMV